MKYLIITLLSGIVLSGVGCFNRKQIPNIGTTYVFNGKDKWFDATECLAQRDTVIGKNGFFIHSHAGYCLFPAVSPISPPPSSFSNAMHYEWPFYLDIHRHISVSVPDSMGNLKVWFNPRGITWLSDSTFIIKP